MRLRLAPLLLGVAACTWSNSLYQARAVSAEALKAEREGRPGDAENAWGRAAFKAESAYVRSPEGGKAAEALWLQGRALARGRDCVRASAALERSALLLPNAPWDEALTFELARCREALQDGGAVALFLRLTQSRDTTIRQIAQRRAGLALIREGRWQEALTLLHGVEGSQERLNRAVALASLGRLDEAVAEFAPLASSTDSTLDFAPLVTAFARQGDPRTDSILACLGETRGVPAERGARLLLAAAQGAIGHAPEAVDRRLHRLLREPSSPSVRTGELLLADRVVGRANSPADLLLRLDSLKAFAEEGLPFIRANELRRIGGELVTEESATAAGSARGDLVLFSLAEVARDSLAAPTLASSLFARIERDWPRSDYLAKSLMARLPLAPDSAPALRARLAALPPNPYLAYLRGEQDSGFVRLEDSLLAYTRERVQAASGRRARPGNGVDPL
ncbi:MAG: hypothetical protein ABJC19_07820 [Gemmatimonadota bacterium]